MTDRWKHSSELPPNDTMGLDNDAEQISDGFCWTDFLKDMSDDGCCSFVFPHLSWNGIDCISGMYLFSHQKNTYKLVDIDSIAYDQP